ncbi:MAG: flagellar biosynthetic protein FliR [Burkholderiales bacterium]|nr:flagellar biosynthetic protein FliR [Burkholderiales bacterium]HMM51124.1 flagellar biosynthetic protein FliR [Burkholderiaceae bacterium]
MIQVGEAQLLGWLSAFLLPFFRILGLFGSAPVLSQRSVPMRLRIALSLMLAALAAPLLPPAPAADLGAPAGWLAVASEALIGFAIGFVARAILASVEVAGEAVGLQMGLSFAGFFDPESGQLNAVSRLMNTLSLWAFVTIGGPALMVAAAVHSFEVIPPATALGDWIGRMQPAALGAGLFELGVRLALPFMALLLFANLALGIISRIAPQLNIFAIGFPVTIGAGLVLLALGMPLLQAPFELIVERMVDALRM